MELLVSLKHVDKSMRNTGAASLFSFLNRTFTASGARMLRTNILQPSADLRVINERLDVVEELIGNEPVSHQQLLLCCSFCNSVA